MIKDIIIAWLVTSIIGIGLIYFELLPNSKVFISIISIVIFVIALCLVGIVKKTFK